MARLIDANALRDRFKLRLDWLKLDVHDEYTKGLYHGCDYDMTLINELPTVDAVEVVHGRWEDEYGGKYANPRYRCSVCKKRALYKFERDLLGKWNEVQELTTYCPYCMAQLDGGKGE